MSPVPNNAAVPRVSARHRAHPGAFADHRRAAASAARDATSAFLGRLDICGVGLSHDPVGGFHITFLLRQDSAKARTVLAAWASERRVHIEVKIATRNAVSLETPN